MSQLTQPILLRRQQVEVILSLSRASIYARLNPKDKGYDPGFPRPIKVGAATVRWRQSEIEAYIASLPRTPAVATMVEV